MQPVNKKPLKGADSHHHQHARLVVAYQQSQSQASSHRHRGDKSQWILMISTSHELRSQWPTTWGEIQKSGFEKL